MFVQETGENIAKTRYDEKIHRIMKIGPYMYRGSWVRAAKHRMNRSTESEAHVWVPALLWLQSGSSSVPSVPEAEWLHCWGHEPSLIYHHFGLEIFIIFSVIYTVHQKSKYLCNLLPKPLEIRINYNMVFIDWLVTCHPPKSPVIFDCLLFQSDTEKKWNIGFILCYWSTQ